MTLRLKIGFLAYRNPYFKTSYSGVLYYMMQELKRHPGIELHVLGHYPKTRLEHYFRKLLRINTDFTYKKRDFGGLDVVVAPVASDLLAAFGDQISAPIVYITDATPSYLREFYPVEIMQKDDEIEHRALKCSDHVIYSSQYMADRALQEYSELKCKPLDVVPYGVNLDNAPTEPTKKPPMDPLNIVLIASNWDRKGGDIALAALYELLDRGVSATLTIVGPGPAGGIAHPNVIFKGFIDKQRPKQSEIYNDILRKAHILISPTRADCTPMVVGEANAFSCPVVITNVGGVGSLINEGVNGKMMRLDDGAKEWADAIMKLTVQNDDYQGLCESSFAFAGRYLNWTSWAQAVFEHACAVVRA